MKSKPKAKIKIKSENNSTCEELYLTELDVRE